MMAPRAAVFVLFYVSITLCFSCNEVMAWQSISSSSSSRRMMVKATTMKSSRSPIIGTTGYHHQSDGPEIQPSPRRQFLFQITKTAATVTAAVATTIVMLPDRACNAATAAPGMTVDLARGQWRQVTTALDDLLQNWATVEGGGGDAIPDALRTKLGTQGITSPLFQIEKAFKSLRDSEYVDDFIEFQETTEEFIGALYRADSMAASANNKTGSGKQTPPAVFIENARVEVVEMQRIAKKLNSMVK